MRYNSIKKGIFVSRPNRFIAYVEIDGETVKCHVKNTGRCKELLIPGVTVYLEEALNPKRSTRYSLIAVQKGIHLINMDSQAPNKVVYEWLKEGNLLKDTLKIKPEQVYKNSRFDFYLETSGKKIFMEVKGVTLEEEGTVLFPDAPTERGVKHIRELCECLQEGYDAYILFVVQMEAAKYFKPNDRTHKEFGEALRRANSQGVKIIAMNCIVTPDSLKLKEEIPVILD
ncbi:DNA/RNA nuclease SfsA [Anaerocolumna xylanovorans]|uniref:Sugar fermentation stimulation protein homolog n=1 Tax=Anaerocolumna xylanovorans DSM 12503 TaxID=1121345 RepID=A0A1M7Y8H7_9FIRM|nr:DNA/RNA nuclease SfsA [Anaerocolumna xylanovorans]SHO48856.1 sugar fermentation stimulation protein A [Anaerocolumna xylanovorans DSM 12503]